MIRGIKRRRRRRRRLEEEEEEVEEAGGGLGMDKYIKKGRKGGKQRFEY